LGLELVAEATIGTAVLVEVMVWFGSTVVVAVEVAGIVIEGVLVVTHPLLDRIGEHR
jgi:hypothetical protein